MLGMPLNNTIVRMASFKDEVKWDDFINSNPMGTPYHYFAWKKAIEAAYDFDCLYFMAERDGNLTGVFPIAHIQYPFGRGFFVALPYCDVGSILAETNQVAKALFSEAWDQAIHLGVKGLEIRQTCEEFDPEAESTSYGHDPRALNKARMILPLPGSSQKLLSSFRSKLRSQVKKPCKDGLTVRLGSIELLDDFYSIISENMRAIGSPVHSRKWFLCILKYYESRAKCGVVYMPDGIPAAAGIILCHNRIVSIPWASSLRCFNHWNPNMLLYWTFLEYASDTGFDYFDFGRSTPGEGTFYFKRQWGAQPHPLSWQRWRPDKDGAIPAGESVVSQSGGWKRAAVEKMFSKMPLPVSTFLGSRIRKYIPL